MLSQVLHEKLQEQLDDMADTTDFGDEARAVKVTVSKFNFTLVEE